MTTQTLLGPFREAAFKRLEKEAKHPYFSRMQTEYPVESEKHLLTSRPLKKQQMVFINGHFAPELSSLDASTLEGLWILSLEEAYPVYGALIEMQLQSALKKQKGPFPFFSLASAKTPLLFHIEENRKAQLEIVYLQTKEAVFSPIALQVYAERGASCTITTRIEQDPSEQATRFKGCVSSNVLVSLEENATLVWADHCDYGDFGTCASSFFGSLKEGAILRKTSLHGKSERSFEQSHFSLLGGGAQAYASSLLLSPGKTQKEIDVTMEHIHPDTFSSQKIKTIAAGSSKNTFKGKIRVEKEAQKTDSYQLSKALILSEKASVKALPELEIFADDVKASHGSTVASLDDQEAAFYLHSRGIGPKIAKYLMIKAFCQEILDTFPSSRQENIQQSVDEFLQSHAF